MANISVLSIFMDVCHHTHAAQHSRFWECLNGLATILSPQKCGRMWCHVAWYTYPWKTIHCKSSEHVGMLGGGSEFRCLPKISGKSERQLVACRRWLENAGIQWQSIVGHSIRNSSPSLHKLPNETTSALERARLFLDQTQVQENSPGVVSEWYSHISKGAWPFSSGDHGWRILDCSSEGLKVHPCKRYCMSLQAELILSSLRSCGGPISNERLLDRVNVILFYQGTILEYVQGRSSRGQRCGCGTSALKYRLFFKFLVYYSPVSAFLWCSYLSELVCGTMAHQGLTP